MFRIKQKNILAGIIIACISLAVYLKTVAPSIYTADNGEFVTAVFTLGIAHPPGYPVFCVLGKLMTFLPLGDIAYRANLTSVISAVGAVFVVYLVLLRLINGSACLVAASAASLIFAFSEEFWYQAIRAEVYTLNAFFVVLLAYIMILWQESRKRNYVFLWTFVFGISLADHHTVLAMGPVFAGYFLWKTIKDPRPEELTANLFFKCAVFFIAGIFFYAYLPVRSLSAPVLDWGNPETFQRLIDHIQRRQYGGMGIGARPAHVFLQQIWISITAYAVQFSPLVIWLGLPGIWHFYKRNREKFMLTLAIPASFTLGLIILTNPPISPRGIYNNRIFLIPAYMMISTWIGFGIVFLCDRFKGKWVQPVFVVIAVSGIIVNCRANYFHNDQSKNYLARDYGLDILRTADADSILFASGDHPLFILKCLTTVEKRRPDLVIYDDYGWVFKDIYGPEFYKLSAKDQEKKRLVIQRKIAVTSEKTVYFTMGGKVHNMPEIINQPVGILFKIINERNPRVADLDVFWKNYGNLTGRGIDYSKVYQDRWSREITANYYLCRGYYYREKGQRDAAVAEFEEASRTAFDNELLRNNICMVFGQMGLNEKAMKEGEECLKLDPANSAVILNLGNTYTNAGQYDQAIKLYEKVIQLTPTSVDVYHNLGIVYFKEGDLDKAIANQMIALKLNPYFPDAHLSLGTAYYKKHMPEESIQHFKAALAVQPAFIDAHYNLGIVYASMGRNAEAIQELQKYISMNPGPDKIPKVKQWIIELQKQQR